MHDIVIRNGTIVDGTGTTPVTGDVAISDGVITEVGPRITGSATRTIDADGALVTPGWVDVHTHYDGQVSWDSEMAPSSHNGVTTVVMGNCGVGFAPVAPGTERELIELMEGVEDIPGSALHEGMEWGAWESFPDYLDYLAGREYALDVGAQIAHGAVRFYAMGERGRMPLFHRVGDLWALAYRLYDASRRTQHSVVRFSRDGILWTDPARIETGVNAMPQLVQVDGKLLAFNNLYPERHVVTRNEVSVPEWVYGETGD